MNQEKLTGLLLFMALLLPDFVYTVSRERFGIERMLPSLRDTVRSTSRPGRLTVLHGLPVSLNHVDLDMPAQIPALYEGQRGE